MTGSSKECALKQRARDAGLMPSGRIRLSAAAAPIRPATPASRGGAQAPAKGAPGIARDRGDPSRLRFSSKHILTSFQLDSWNTINNGRSATLSGPTSAGKSYVLLLSLVEKFRTNRIKTAAYVVPTRALINQVSDDATEAFREGGLTGTTITSIPVDISSGSSEKILYVVTQERLDALLIASPGLDFDLIIVDEAQMIGDGSRGVLLESAMDRISAQTRDRQILFSGPLIDNPSYFGEIFQIKNFGACTSKKTPITQNIVFLDYIESPDPYASVKSYSGGVKSEVALVHLPVRLLAPLDKISYISYTFGKSGASIVYAAGKADAEKIATKITIEILDKPELDAEELEFIDFVKKHVHKDYALVTTLRKRVGFHYGYMPSLLRKQLENRFRERKINYLVCTSTLLHGLNLPAKNIFLLNPTTGRGNPISGPDFWNLSGRVGRLGKELEGNVFLIDYDAWESKPLSEGKGVIVSSALKDVVMDRSSELIEFLADENISSDIDPELEITLGKLVLDHRNNRLDKTLNRYESESGNKSVNQIRDRISQISIIVNIPTEVLNNNIGVSIFRQKDLFDYFTKRLTQLPPEDLIPAHPLGTFNDVLSNHRRCFKRIHTYLLRYKGADNRHNFFAPLALRWMRGDPLPVLIDSAIRWHQSRKSTKPKASIIRDTMEDVEKDLRFRYVKYFTCYNSLLKAALAEINLEEYIKLVPDVPLFLEVGGSSGSMINLMALGLSRTSAEALSDYINDKEMSLIDLRSWLRRLNIRTLDISPICIREIESLMEKEQIFERRRTDN
ncbi:UNVERIFIED_ORG: hypothetical protein M2442_002879 [Methylorubrum zatmanii]|nr:hypothetical protein [Methylorubrum zatmanii]